MSRIVLSKQQRERTLLALRALRLSDKAVLFQVLITRFPSLIYHTSLCMSFRVPRIHWLGVPYSPKPIQSVPHKSPKGRVPRLRRVGWGFHFRLRQI